MTAHHRWNTERPSPAPRQQSDRRVQSAGYPEAERVLESPGSWSASEAPKMFRPPRVADLPALCWRQRRSEDSLHSIVGTLDVSSSGARWLSTHKFDAS